MNKRYDAILILGGGLTKEGQLPEWSKRRLNKALEMYGGEYIITLSAGTPHKRPLIDKEGFILFEPSVAAEWLIENGVDPAKILREWTSYDTIGNAYFTRVIHTEPRGWRKLIVITSEFHMARTKEIFRWIFSLNNTKPPYKFKFISVTDKDIDPVALISRIEREKARLHLLSIIKESINNLKEFHIWMFREHNAYVTGAKVDKLQGDVLRSF